MNSRTRDLALTIAGITVGVVLSRKASQRVADFVSREELLDDLTVDMLCDFLQDHGIHSIEDLRVFLKHMAKSQERSEQVFTDYMANYRRRNADSVVVTLVGPTFEFPLTEEVIDFVAGYFETKRIKTLADLQDLIAAALLNLDVRENFIAAAASAGHDELIFNFVLSLDERFLEQCYEFLLAHNVDTISSLIALLRRMYQHPDEFTFAQRSSDGKQGIKADAEQTEG
jgi:hypothetical protein